MADWASQGGYAASYAAASGGADSGTMVRRVNTKSGPLFVSGNTLSVISQAALASGARMEDLPNDLLVLRGLSPGGGPDVGVGLSTPAGIRYDPSTDYEQMYRELGAKYKSLVKQHPATGAGSGSRSLTLPLLAIAAYVLLKGKI
jgi:hypothetical protein